MTSVEAQNHFGELLDTAQREPVTITRRGRSVAFVVSARDMEELINIRNHCSQAVTTFESCFAETDNKLKSDAQSVTDEEINSLVHELR